MISLVWKGRTLAFRGCGGCGRIAAIVAMRIWIAITGMNTALYILMLSTYIGP